MHINDGQIKNGHEPAWRGFFIAISANITVQLKVASLRKSETPGVSIIRSMQCETPFEALTVNNREAGMDNQENELRKAVQELADEEGISFADAIDASIKTLRYEIKRRKSFNGEPAMNGGASGLR